MLKQISKPAEVLLEVDEYIGIFKKQDARGRWRKFDSCGNAGVAIDIAYMLRKLGHKVTVKEYTVEREEGFPIAPRLLKRSRKVTRGRKVA